MYGYFFSRKKKLHLKALLILLTYRPNPYEKTIRKRTARQKPFTHLHLHTSYSLLDGAIRIPDLMKHVKSLGMGSVAITDHGNMFGAIEFYRAAKKEGIKPIIGCEFYVAPGGRKEKRNISNLADGNNYHLILLAKNKTGYLNLIRLSSCSYTEGFYRKPRIDYDILEKHSEGLICLTACLGGEVQQHILRNQNQKAENLANRLKEIFGRENFYLEIQDHGLEEEKIALQGNLEIARKHNIELCLTNDSHFLKKKDQEVQDILLRIHQKKTIEDPLFFNFNSEFYVKSPEEMFQLFPEIPQAFYNTTHIAEMIDLDFQFFNPLLPKFDVPKGENLDSYLHKMAWEGLEKRYNRITPEIKERFDHEYNTITQMDFSGYFLIVRDFIQFAKKQNIPCGPGRGSAAGSIISYALEITDVDPLSHGLLFERFLNPDRNELPDIDVDFCKDRREEIIQYVRRKYGIDHVGQIITYGSMGARACIKDIARVLNIPFQEANKVSRMIPDTLNISLEDALSSSPELKEYSQKGNTQKKLFQVALALEGNVRHTGVHAAGIFIAPEALENLLPMATVAAKGGQKERVLVSQYDMQSLEAVGLVKIDFLGLRNLSVINESIEIIHKRKGKRIKFNSQEMNDPRVYKMIQTANLVGIFQLESSPGMRELVLHMKPECFEDIVALIALFRPGPLQSGMADVYINRKKKIEKVQYAHADIKPILANTYGVILYQEQVMQIAQVIAGFSLSEADNLRKAMGKKIKEKMEAMRKKFIDGTIAKGHKQSFASSLFEQIFQFASYGFNKSHSVAYACIVYQTAYLKTHYTTEYMCALLNSGINKVEKLVPYIHECHVLGIQVMGPDINQSQTNFSVVKDKCILFGLAGIKNVGSQAVEYLLKQRAIQPNQSFSSFFHFMENIDLQLCNRRMIEAFIQSGVFSSLGYTKKSLQESVDMGLNHAQKEQKDRVSGQASLFGEKLEDIHEIIPRTGHEREFTESKILSMERELLGCYLSGHPLDKYTKILSKLGVKPLSELVNIAGNTKLTIAALISDFHVRLARNKAEICHLLLEDNTGTCEAIILPNKFKELRQYVIKSEAFLLQVILEKRENTGTPSLLIQEMKKLDGELIEEIQEKALHISLQQNQKKVIQELKVILSAKQGPLRVYFHLMDEKTSQVMQVIRAHESFKVDYNSELCKRLSRIEDVHSIDISIGDKLISKYKKREKEIIPIPTN